MSVFLGYAASLFRPGVGVPGRLKSISIPLYQRTPSALAVAGPALLVFDALLIASTVPVTWNHWKTAPEPNGKPRELRPWWMRAAACSVELATGLLLASSILIYRARTVTLISILPPKNPSAVPTGFNRRIFLQNAGSWRGVSGTIFPLSACTVTRVDEKVLFLQVKGEYQGWQLNLEKSHVDGEPAADAEKACKTFAAHWEGAGGKATILHKAGEA
ncbi:hypothetical protein B0H15DRAFT_550348 [Mycena belliarum]|uniref:Uncharacterized protein n=1 Tax=Mycena belliarum TaxID=1033014 RepID=A0AAD6UE84_9AGAR|nr:hypothetical protein B0H15DRAFT_550348 [Mycena belliae]